MYYFVIQMIGEFEYLILTSAARLGADAYGASIRKEIEKATGLLPGGIMGVDES